MRVLFIAAEMAPFAKTGGLGDVVGSLPAVLQTKGIDARALIPLHGPIKAAFGDRLEHIFTFKFSRRTGTADVRVYRTEHDGVPVYLLESWPFFGEGGDLYTDINWDRERFVFFAQAAMGAVWELGQGRDRGVRWTPDVLHVHDWHAALIPFLLREARYQPGWEDIASVLTIHNMAYQGWDAGGYLWMAGVPGRHDPNLVYQDKTDNLLGIGIAYADKLNTVSPRHAIELHYPRFGEGLEGLIWVRDGDLAGILNGLDMKRYDPATDPALEQRYGWHTFREKRIENKRALQYEFGLEPLDDAPIIGIVSRLVAQKGIGFAAEGLRWVLAETGAQLIVLGSGEPEIEQQVRQLEWDFGWKAKAYIGYNEAVAQRIYAGADMILVPSRYEPCGLTQMIAMRYGALPVVRETGGLADTVTNYDNGPADQGTGFVFLWEESEAVRHTLRWAIDTYRHRRDAWQRMQERAMRTDWSWERPVQRYIELYEQALYAVGRGPISVAQLHRRFGSG